jgi:hypothetical protein
MERTRIIEILPKAWPALILPLNYVRKIIVSLERPEVVETSTSTLEVWHSTAELWSRTIYTFLLLHS